MACWRSAISPGSGPIRLGAGNLDRAEDRSRLVHRLVPLVVRLRVDDGAAARLHVHAAVLDHDGADVDRRVEVDVPAQVADRAAVGGALHPLQRLYYLYR